MHLLVILLPGLLAGFLLGWACCRIFTSFQNGEMPLVSWQTHHKKTFGLLWTAAVLCVLAPAYLGTMLVSISLFRLELSEGPKPSSRTWIACVVLAALLILATFCVRVAVTAWFPSRMHPPFGSYQGGIGTGLFTVICALSLMILALLLAKRLSAKLQKTSRRN